MTNREIDCVIIGFSVGALAFLWVGYKLGERVERWRSGRAAKQRAARSAAKSVPFDGSNLPASCAPSTRRVLAERPGVIPLKRRDLENPTLRQLKRDPNTGRTRDHHANVQRIPIPIVGLAEATQNMQGFEDSWPSLADAAKRQAAETSSTVREDALAALTGAGYKRAAAEAALDACSLAERAGGLESWVAAALRHASAKT